MRDSIRNNRGCPTGLGRNIEAATIAIGSAAIAALKPKSILQTVPRQWGAFSLLLLVLLAAEDRSPAQTFVRSDSLKMPPYAPLGIAVADLNTDGSLDMVVGYWSGRLLTVVTNNGNGTFTIASTINFQESFPLLFADVSGDGKLDLISGARTNTLTILTNAGDGTFRISATNTVGSASGAIEAVDLNGDAKLDLVTANRDQSTLTVLTNIHAMPTDTLKLSWSAAWPGFELQRSSTLLAATWEKVTNSVEAEAGTNRVQLGAPPGQAFYRLVHP